MKKIIIPIIILLFTANLFAALKKKEVLVKILTPEIAWADSKLESKIHTSFSRQSNVKINIVNSSKQSTPQFPENYYDTDLLLNWGNEIGGRYVMIIDVQSERLETRKSFHIPLIFHKYQTYGIIEGEMRLFDLERNKLVAVHSFKVEEKGSRIFQATMDDDINDPDLHISAPKKIQFFSKLEDKLVLELKKKTKVYFGSR